LQSKGIRVLLAGHAHSEGDLAVYDENDGVLYMGDLFVNGHVGYLGEAQFQNWIRFLSGLEKLPVHCVVPGHGPLGTKKDLQFFRKYLIDFVNSTRQHFDAGGSLESYQLPEKYRNLGSQFFMKDNLERAFELWKKGEL
jgi:glyoxylase-like metal-dependent hydrolase (beta-lactamase superfamily II)